MFHGLWQERLSLLVVHMKTYEAYVIVNLLGGGPHLNVAPARSWHPVCLAC